MITIFLKIILIQNLIVISNPFRLRGSYVLKTIKKYKPILQQSRAAEPRPFDPGGKYFESDPVSIPVSKPKSISKSLEDASPRRSLLWSNPAPFGSQKAQNVIRHVEAPRAKVEKTHQPPPPVQKFSPAGRYSLDPSKFR